jgi:hypothetical protein
MAEMPHIAIFQPWPVRLAHALALLLAGFLAALTLRGLVSELWLGAAAVAASGLLFGYCLVMAVAEARSRRARICRRLCSRPDRPRENG